MQLIIYIFLYPILWCISMLPFRLLYLLSDGFYILTYYIIGYRKKIVRENLLPGAILTRVASSHIRVGTFQYIAAKQNINDLNNDSSIFFFPGV